MVLARRESITAIDSEKLPSVLRRLGLYDDVIYGRAKCYICGKTLNLDGIGGIMGVNGMPVLICDSVTCIAKASIFNKTKSYEHSKVF